MSEIKERPILFSAEMVNAILDRRKTQTRRIIKPQPDNDIVFAPYSNMAVYKGETYYLGRPIWHCPYGKPGDLLWVRETIGIQLEPCEEYPNGYVIYKADLPPGSSFQYEGGGSAWTPSIFMPRWASRITLKITSVRVERLQDISEEDAIAEGAPLGRVLGYGRVGMQSHKEGLIDLWDSINIKNGYPWESNPWVWVIEFETVSGE